MSHKTGCQTISYFLVFFWLVWPAYGQGIRKPVWAGQFYDSDQARLDRQLELWLESAEMRTISGELVGLIAPHAGYAYSGRVAACGVPAAQGP